MTDIAGRKSGVNVYHSGDDGHCEQKNVRECPSHYLKKNSNYCMYIFHIKY